MNPRVELIFFGTELLTGQINSHLGYMGERLASLGLAPARAVTVGDDLKECVQALRESFKRSTLVITCGGLGPTFDDLTREALSKALSIPLVFVPKLLTAIQQRFAQRGISMPQDNKRQAYVLRGAKVLHNAHGTAPGQLLVSKGRMIVVLPGPGSEMKPMFEAVMPLLKRRLAPGFSVSHSLHLFGLPESVVAERIQPVLDKARPKDVSVVFGILAHQAIIDVKWSVSSSSAKKGDVVDKDIEKGFRDILGGDIYGQDSDTLESVVGRLLKSKSQTISVAESCTGGLITHKLTNVPGSSDYLLDAVVAYSNVSKRELLKVLPETLQSFGAVSAPVAKEMAVGIKRISGSTWGLSTTGIAGPSGGSSEKPVGLMHMAVAGPQGVADKTFQTRGARAEIKEKMALAALDFLRRILDVHESRITNHESRSL